jgi:hypothetical protein
LVAGLTRKNADDDLQVFCMQVLNFLLKRFGSVIAQYHENLFNGLLKLLEHQKDSCRKQANTTLGELVPFLNDTLFQRLMQTIIEQIDVCLLCLFCLSSLIFFFLLSMIILLAPL